MDECERPTIESNFDSFGIFIAETFIKYSNDDTTMDYEHAMPKSKTMGNFDSVGSFIAKSFVRHIHDDDGERYELKGHYISD